MKDKNKLKNLLEKLKNREIPEDRIAKTIALFGREMFKEARKEVEKYIHSKDEIIRYNALVTLILDWGLQEHYETAKKLLLNDSDEDVRGLGAACMGSLKRGANDKEALRTLLKVFKNKKEHWLVRSSAYSAILDIIGVPRQEQPGALGDDYEKDVDWDIIEKAEKILLEYQKKRDR